MEENKIDNNQQVIDLGAIAKTLWAKRKVFFIMWPIVFALSCLWIFPQPRYYTCDVALAPENSDGAAGGLAGIASSFGFNIGDMTTSDAIYPTLYPDLFESPEFLVDLLSIKIQTDDGQVKTDYYTYLKKHQKKNPITQPFVKMKKSITSFFSDTEKDGTNGNGTNGKINPFYMSKKDFDIVEGLKLKITCNVDKKTDVISISVKDQDRLVCALLADSIRERLQNYIIVYRTKKVRQDEAYYKHLTDSALLVYQQAAANYGSYQDSHRNVTLQTYVEHSNKIKNDLDSKLQAYNTFNTQYQAMKAKVQERTPSFTTLKSATVPQKPAGPKRMIFVLGMLVFCTIVAMFWLARNEILVKN